MSKIEINENYGSIKIKSRGREYTAKFDIEDLDRVKSYSAWYIHHDKTGSRQYAFSHETRYGKLHKVYLHRMALSAPTGAVVDHIISDCTLDCRKKNLRVVTNRENSLNRRPNCGKKHKGIEMVVNKYGDIKYAVACARIYGGRYENYRDALLAYDFIARIISRLSLVHEQRLVSAYDDLILSSGLTEKVLRSMPGRERVEVIRMLISEVTGYSPE
jgi:hypothetical protein